MPAISNSALPKEVHSARRLRRLAFALVSLWVLAMIAVPVVRWLGGETALIRGVWLCVLLQAAAVMVALCAVWGAGKALAKGAIVVGLAWVVELLGSRTGIPFGRYAYTSALQPQVLGVPLLIPVAWLMMLPPAWAVGARIVGPRRGFLFAIVAALAFAAWDLFLDPQMVDWGFWEWASAGGYFGVPWSNFAGWLLCAWLITLVARPAPLPLWGALPLTVLYTLTWALQSVGMAFFWGQWGAATAGFAGMGIFVLLAWMAPAARPTRASVQQPSSSLERGAARREP